VLINEKYTSQHCHRPECRVADGYNHVHHPTRHYHRWKKAQHEHRAKKVTFNEPLHALLACHGVYLNRDTNSSFNMAAILRSILTDGARPVDFR
jgi:hypothetical protein